MVTIILAGLALCGIIFVLSPIFFGNKANGVAQNETIDNRISELNEHKKIIFTLLRDMEFEYKTGKISNTDFEKLKNEYENKVILIYQEMDHLTAVTEKPSKISADNG